MRTIIKLEQSALSLPVKKRVAAYARVSRDTEQLHHSLSAQVSYYSERIQRNPEWEYAGVYADEGISGTSAKDRTEFQRLLADCETGKIDIILTKSISRFARNTVDLLNTVRHLRELGVEVHFERENINSLSGDGEVMLTLLASFAQEESLSISSNIKWGFRKRFEKGIPCRHFPTYGYRWHDDTLIIEPEEADVVRLIFDSYLKGLSIKAVANLLIKTGITAPTGGNFSPTTARKVLSNITYTGNLLLQKSFIADPITKKAKLNRGELPQYIVETHHESIISMEQFNRVQNELVRRRELQLNPAHAICFARRIRCGNCGASYKRRKEHGISQTYVWICRTLKTYLQGWINLYQCCD